LLIISHGSHLFHFFPCIILGGAGVRRGGAHPSFGFALPFGPRLA
jgi:hypothetical protein